MSKEIEDLRTRVEEVEMKTATNQSGIKRLSNELTESNKKIRLLDQFTTELSRYHIKEKEKIPCFPCTSTKSLLYWSRTRNQGA